MIRGVILASVLVAQLSALCSDALAGTATGLPPASPEVERFIREALEDRLAANAVAGYRLNVRSGKRVPILDHLPKSRLQLSALSLPQFRDYEFYLVSTEEAQAQADRSGTPVFYIRVDQPALGEIEASLWIGTDLAIPSQDHGFKLCCCNERAHFQWANGRWSFVRRSDILCS